MKLEFPSKKHKEMYINLINNWGKSETIPTSPSRLFAGNDFSDFLELIKKDTTDSETGVNSHLFFLINDNEILGAIQIRHNINHPNLIENGGHIGYGIAPRHRRKGYATKMLELGLIEAKKLGLKKVLITCYLDNIGSNKVIKSNGGIFERITKDGLDNRYL
ncbi:MAG: GNAT family N-acetyltransferase, partial [Candidatus Gracilibacteria bacterium]